MEYEEDEEYCSLTLNKFTQIIFELFKENF